MNLKDSYLSNGKDSKGLIRTVEIGTGQTTKLDGTTGVASGKSVIWIERAEVNSSYNPANAYNKYTNNPYKWEEISLYNISIGNYLPLSGGTITGDLTVTNNINVDHNLWITHHFKDGTTNRFNLSKLFWYNDVEYEESYNYSINAKERINLGTISYKYAKVHTCNGDTSGFYLLKKENSSYITLEKNSDDYYIIPEHTKIYLYNSTSNSYTHNDIDVDLYNHNQKSLNIVSPVKFRKGTLGTWHHDGDVTISKSLSIEGTFNTNSSPAYLGQTNIDGTFRVYGHSYLQGLEVNGGLNVNHSVKAYSLFSNTNVTATNGYFTSGLWLGKNINSSSIHFGYNNSDHHPAIHYDESVKKISIMNASFGLNSGGNRKALFRVGSSNDIKNSSYSPNNYSNLDLYSNYFDIHCGVNIHDNLNVDGTITGNLSCRFLTMNGCSISSCGDIRMHSAGIHHDINGCGNINMHGNLDLDGGSISTGGGGIITGGGGINTGGGNLFLSNIDNLRGDIHGVQDILASGTIYASDIKPYYHLTAPNIGSSTRQWNKLYITNIQHNYIKEGEKSSTKVDLASWNNTNHLWDIDVSNLTFKKAYTETDSYIYTFPDNTGTIALTKDIPSVTSYYWANIQITSSANKFKEPQLKSVLINDGTTGDIGCKMIYDATNKCLKFVF